jgi:DNA invertase Pin-like site-specific DNA recombinase
VTKAIRAVGYVRVSTEEQVSSGVSGKSLAGQPGLAAAVEAVEELRGDTLVVAKLDRLSRSLLDCAGLMERLSRKNSSLMALDLAIGTSGTSGELMANILATFAQFERRLIGRRTRGARSEKRREDALGGRRSWARMSTAVFGANVRLVRPTPPSPTTINELAGLRAPRPTSSAECSGAYAVAGGASQP